MRIVVPIFLVICSVLPTSQEIRIRDVLSMTRSFASGMDCSCDPDECVCCTRNDRDEVCVDILVGPSPDVAMYFRDTYVPITAQSKDGLVFGNCFDVFPGLVQICFDIYDIRLNLKGFNICAKFTVTMMKKDQLIDLGCFGYPGDKTNNPGNTTRPN